MIFIPLRPDEVTDNLYAHVYKRYKAKNEAIAKKTFPIIKDVLENNTQYENIGIPVTDGIKTMQVITNLKKLSTIKEKK